MRVIGRHIITTCICAVGLHLSGQMVLTVDQAAASTTTVEVDRPAHFETTTGEDVLVAAGIYMVDSGENSLILLPTQGENPPGTIINAQREQHTEVITAPVALFVAPGEESAALALLLPDGTSMVASGSFSGTRARAITGLKVGPTIQATFQAPNTPNPPDLLNPEEAVVFQAGSASTSQQTQFRWKRAAAGIAPQFYRFMMEEADNPAGFKTGIVEIAHIDPTVYTSRIISAYFADKRVRWNVSACVRGSGTVNVQCSRNSSRIFTWGIARPLPPPLLQPLAGVTTTPGSVSFSWQGISNASSYLLCISKPGVACSASEINNANTIVIRRLGNQATSGQLDVSRFIDQTVNWTVASCDSNNRCAYQQQVRPIKIERELPQLLTPGYGMTIGVRPHVEWTTVPWAKTYLLCFSKPGFACPTQEVPAGANQNTVVNRYLGGESSDLSVILNRGVTPPDLTQFSGSSVNWTVAACDTLFQGGPPANCKYQPQFRQVRIGDAWSVRITLDHLDVHDTYDNVSPGDWRLSFIAMKTTSGGGRLLQIPTAYHQKQWPRDNRGSRDADKGKALAIGESLWISMSPNEQLTVTVGVVDCDVDGLATFLNVFNGIDGIIDTLKNWTQYCGGEEIYEVTGNNDYVGTALLTLTPQDWVNRNSFSVTAPGLGGAHGTTAFTAHFTVTSSRN